MNFSGPADQTPDAMRLIEEQLGPFDPPTSYAFEPELRGEVPRPIPDILREGPYGQGQRQAVVGLVAAAVCCLIGAVIPVVRHWGDYILPLAYLGWIGAGLAVLAAGVWIKQRVSKGAYAYVEYGTPLVGRVCAQTLRCTLVMNGTPTTYKFAVVVQFRDPQTGELLYTELESKDLSALVKDKRKCSFRVGDYVTLVHLGNRPDESLQLYGFLGLRPEMGVVNRADEVSKGSIQTALEVSGVFAGIFLFFYGMFTALQLFPIETPSAVAIPVAVGAALSVGIGSWLIYRSSARQQRRLDERNATAVSAGEAIELQVDRSGASRLFYTVIIGLGLAMLGAAVVGGSLFYVNASLDRSPAQRRQIEIDEMIQTTHNFVVREYSIKYHFPDNPQTHTYRTSLKDIERFPGLSPNAVVRAGYLGWAWVERLEPEMPGEANGALPPNQPAAND